MQAPNNLVKEFGPKLIGKTITSTLGESSTVAHCHTLLTVRNFPSPSYLPRTESFLREL